MTIHLQREIDQLKRNVLSLGAAVEECLWNSVKSVTNRDAELARSVIDGDPQIDRMEVEVEEECLKILALHQPVAVDLRFIVTAMKMTNDLERIGDLATHIAEVGEFLSGQPMIDVPFDLHSLASTAQIMVRKGLDALVNMDASVAREVLQADDRVDAIHRKMYAQTTQAIRDHGDWLDRLLRYRSVSRYLERVADHATNIAEDVIYMVEGRIVRHRENGD